MPFGALLLGRNVSEGASRMRTLPPGEVNQRSTILCPQFSGFGRSVPQQQGIVYRDQLSEAVFHQVGADLIAVTRPKVA